MSEEELTLGLALGDIRDIKANIDACQTTIDEARSMSPNDPAMNMLLDAAQTRLDIQKIEYEHALDSVHMAFAAR